MAPLGILLVCYENVLLGIRTFGNGELLSSASAGLVFGSQDIRAVSLGSKSLAGGIKLPCWRRTGFAVGLTVSVKVFPWLSWPGVLGFSIGHIHRGTRRLRAGKDVFSSRLCFLPAWQHWQALLACSEAGICSVLKLRSRESELLKLP